MEKLHPDDKMEEIRKEIQERNPRSNPFRNARNMAIQKFLLKPDQVIPILEKRLAATTPGGLR